MSSPDQKPLCEHCGQTVDNFLHQMEEHNLQVVCPSCGKNQSGDNQHEKQAKSNPAADPKSSKSPRQN